MALENSPAPEFPGDLRWINVDHPVRLHEDLRGHIVVVHCWTASSVHCQHTLSTLAFLEQRFAEWPFQVIGMHCGKFDAEREHEVVRAAVHRLGVRHMVIVDRDRRLWDEWQCRSWPTLALVDQTGEVRFHGAGEPDRVRLGQAIDALIRDAESSGELAVVPFRGAPSAEACAATGLSFPAAAAVDAEREVLWIADTGHNRIIAADWDSGRVAHVVGDGRPGAGDGGDLGSATFSGPRGVAVSAGTVYVADTGNHLLRAIGVDTGLVETLAGTGRKGSDLVGGQFSTDQPLCSPWGLAVHEDSVWLTMAGTHQVWRFDPETHGAEAVLGTGVEGLVDGGFESAVLGQPTGLASGESTVALVDAATSAVRLIDPDGVNVTTLTGTGSFVFGDADGGPDRSRLQQPLGVAIWRGDPVVADTLNHRIRVVDATTREVRTVLGPEHGLRWPEGVAAHGDVLFVVDTGNHRILRVEPGADGGDLEIRELSPASLRPPVSVGRREVPKVTLLAYGGIELRVRLPVPDGEFLHSEVPVLLRARDESGESILAQDFDETVEVIDGRAVVDYLALAGPGVGKLWLEASYVTCVSEDAVGHRQVVGRVVPVELAESGETELIVD